LIKLFNWFKQQSMKLTLLFLLSAISFSCSAQWYKVFKTNDAPRTPQKELALAPVQFKLSRAAMSKPVVNHVALEQTWYGLVLNEVIVRKAAQHSMRFHEYADASYGFRDLARIYLQLGKLTEAKWFFLQSLTLSREQNMDRLTIASLMELGTLKATIGDFSLAKQDLDEANGLAAAHGWKDDQVLVNKKIAELESNRIAAVKGGGGSTVSVSAL
jgi:hypothetical protein